MYQQDNILIVTVLGLLVIAGLGFYLHKLNKKYPNMKLGAILSAMGVDHNETFMIVIMVAIYIAEAVVASTITISGEAPPSPLGRFLFHMGISFLGAVCGITAWRDIATCFKPNYPARYRIPHIGATLAVLVASLWLPVFNTSLIAANLGQDIQYELYLMDWYRTDNSMRNIYEAYGYPPNYYPWGNMLAMMKVSIGGLYVHALIIIIEGLRNMASPARQDMLFKSFDELAEQEGRKDDKKKDEKKDDKKKDEGEETEARKYLNSNIEFLLTRWGYSKDELPKMVNLAVRALDGIKDNGSKLAILTSIQECVTDAKRADGKAAGAKTDKEILAEIKRIFSSSPRESNKSKMGLGITLKSGKN